MVGRPDERSGALLALDRPFVMVACRAEVPAEIGQAGQGAVDAAEAHQRAGRHDEPIGERNE
jgi:hypothetical protein